MQNKIVKGCRYSSKSRSRNIHWKTPVLACNFMKMRLLRKCVPVNLAKFLRTYILNKICQQLLLRKQKVNKLKLVFVKK